MAEANLPKGNAAQAQVADATEQEDQVMVRPKLPMFWGNIKDPLTFTGWCEGVLWQQQQQYWDNEHTASYIIKALREEAALW